MPSDPSQNSATSPAEPRRPTPAAWFGKKANDWEGHSTGPIPESIGWSVTSYLISGPMLFGIIGYGLDWLFGTTFLLLMGILGGMTLSQYVIWVRYGTQ